MKRQLIFFLLLVFSLNIVIAQKVQWIVTEDTLLELYKNTGYEEIQKNVELYPSDYTALDVTKNSVTYIYYKDKKGKIDADKLIPKKSLEFFAPELLDANVIILPYYNFDILSERQRNIFKNKFEKEFYDLSCEDYTEQECYEYIIERSSKRQLAFTNPIISLDVNNQQSFVFYNIIIKRNKNGYTCEGILDYKYNFDYFLNSPTKGYHVLLIQFDGDYINVYEDSEDKLLMKYAITNEKTFNEFNNLILTGKCDLSKVTWPRHADGSSDYDNEIKPPKFNFAEIKVNPANSERAKENKIQEEATSITNVTKNKTMHVAENLKLRSGEATSTQVLTVMAAGTKVKILELGKSETIDGINSNWVKVEVQKGAKDREGKPIKAGTVGWCYGGYLE